MDFRRTFAALCVGVFSVSTSQAFAQNCDAILATGLADRFNFTDNTRIEDAASMAICSNRTRSSSSNSTFGFSFPIPELSTALGLNSSNEISRDRVDEFCQSGQEVSSRQAAVSLATSVLNPAAIDAWSTCVAQQGGLYCEANNLGGGQFSVTVSWRRQNVGPGTEQVTLQGGAQLANATCPTPVLQDGASILDDSSLTQICRFDDPSAPATLVMNTSQGALTCQVEPEAPSIDTNEVASLCYAGDTTSCLTLIQLTQDALQICDSTPQSNFALYIQCGNARTGLRSLLSSTAAVDRACWRNSDDCSSALLALSQTGPIHAATVEALLTGSSNLGPVSPTPTPLFTPSTP